MVRNYFLRVQKLLLRILGIINKTIILFRKAFGWLVGIWRAIGKRSILCNAMRIIIVCAILCIPLWLLLPRGVHAIIHSEADRIVARDGILSKMEYVGSSLSIEKCKSMRIYFNDESRCTIGNEEYIMGPFSSITLSFPQEDNTKYWTTFKDKDGDISCNYLAYEYQDNKTNSFIGLKGEVTIGQMTIANIHFESTLTMKVPYETMICIFDNHIKKQDVCLKSIPEISINGGDRITIAFDEEDPAEITFSSARVCNVDFDSLEQISVFEGTGSFLFSYTAKADQYELMGHNIKIFGDDEGISFNVRLNDEGEKTYTIEATGTVVRALISDIDLFPSILGWLRGNVYVLPTLFLTVIGGAISLVNNNTKDEKGKEK